MAGPSLGKRSDIASRRGGGHAIAFNPCLPYTWSLPTPTARRRTKRRTSSGLLDGPCRGRPPNNCSPVLSAISIACGARDRAHMAGASRRAAVMPRVPRHQLKVDARLRSGMVHSPPHGGDVFSRVVAASSMASPAHMSRPPPGESPRRSGARPPHGSTQTSERVLAASRSTKVRPAPTGSRLQGVPQERGLQASVVRPGRVATPAEKLRGRLSWKTADTASGAGSVH